MIRLPENPCGEIPVLRYDRPLMRQQPPSIRILPMSDKQSGFQGLTLDQVQTTFFLKDLPAHKGLYHYRSAGLNAPHGTLVLFQFKAHIVAGATFRRDEKFERPLHGHAGILHFDPASIRTFTPLDLAAMRHIWPRFHAFGHAKQFLNPTAYPTLQKHLRHLTSAKTKVQPFFP
jgi:hypothetical protein